MTDPSPVERNSRDLAQETTKLLPVSGLAQVSLLISLVPFLIITPPLSLTLGLLALRQVRDGRRSGGDIAASAVVIAGLFCVVILVSALLSIATQGDR